MRSDDFPVDLFSLQLDELKLLQDRAPEAKSQRTPCPVDDIDLFLGNSLGAFSLSILDDDDESKLISTSSVHSDDGHTFVTPLPTPPFTPTPSRCRTPCSSGQSSPQRYSSGQTSPVWERSHGGTRTPDRSHGGTRTPDRSHGGTRTPDRSHGGTRTPDRSHGGTRTPDGATGGNSSDTTQEKVPRYKRPSHIKAEYKRRGKIQKGFEDLQTVVPSLADTQQPFGKHSKSTMLLKTVEFLRHVRNENKSLLRETDKLRAEIRVLTADINSHQEELPAAGVMVAPPAASQPAPADMQSMFEEYMRTRTRHNWKFWIFGLIIRPLFNTFNSIVARASTEEFCQTLLNWVETHCSLVVLRPAAFHAVRHISTNTSILATPQRLPQDVMDLAVPMELAEPSRDAEDISPPRVPAQQC